ncbi:LOW QUALITY PROTEIN: hypothetical protein Cgig2_009397 [Carnegiea gigantea]|uniref:Endonuclease/exonuclease/phosphatase domain-containing protein n=1 Tax=Carnegiea gigantea TaxID=171969 RepID=A0A9Q1JSH9_9CARY|nr:LOW QUALITY PROTEIN: hypothetical protein Cgig2_009397 [Carnegiea gigantea]
METATVDFISCSMHHIDITIKWEGEDVTWRSSGVYGWPGSQEKWKTGAPLSDLRTHSRLPWLMGGDLNEIFHHSEKKRGPSKSQTLIDKFRESFLDNGLYDLGYSGYEFTWRNYQQNGTVVEERLDRFCADTDWSLSFPNAHVTHGDSDISDHLPILLKFPTQEM